MLRQTSEWEQRWPKVISILQINMHWVALLQAIRRPLDDLYLCKDIKKRVRPWMNKCCFSLLYGSQKYSDTNDLVTIILECTDYRPKSYPADHSQHQQRERYSDKVHNSRISRPRCPANLTAASRENQPQAQHLRTICVPSRRSPSPPTVWHIRVHS